MAEMAIAAPMHLPQPLGGKGRDLRLVFLGAGLALCAHYVLQWLGHMPWWQRISRRFIWWHSDALSYSPYGTYAGAPDAGYCSCHPLCDAKTCTSSSRFVKKGQGVVVTRDSSVQGSQTPPQQRWCFTLTMRRPWSG